MVAIIIEVNSRARRDGCAWPDVRLRVQKHLRSSEQGERTLARSSLGGFLEERASGAVLKG